MMNHFDSLYELLETFPTEESCVMHLERYLANQLKPIEGTNHPTVAPIEVNLPA